MLGAFGFLALSIALLMLQSGEWCFVCFVALVGGSAGLCIAPVVPLMHDVANSQGKGSEATTFWQVVSVFDVAYALGISLGPFFAGIAASGHYYTGAGTGGIGKWAQQCVGVDLCVVIFGAVLFIARRKLESLGPEVLLSPIYAQLSPTCIALTRTHHAGAYRDQQGACL